MIYEIIKDIKNSCSNNQMRDVFFDEVDCESPVEYVRSLHAGKNMEITEEPKEDGGVVIYLTIDNLTQKYLFTPI